MAMNARTLILIAALMAAVFGLVGAALPAEWVGDDGQPALKIEQKGSRLLLVPDVPAGWTHSERYITSTSGKTWLLVIADDGKGKPDGESYHLFRYILTLPGPTPAPEPDVNPEPKPQPKPEPKPEPPRPLPPAPVEKLGWCIVIEESADRVLNPKVVGVYADKGLRDTLKAAGVQWRLADKDAVDETGNPSPDVQTWARRATKLPALFLVSESGRVMFEGPCPDTVDGFRAVLKDKGGLK
jgi:hypothetical protein